MICLRLGLHSNSVPCVHVALPTFRFILFWVNVYVNDSDVNIVSIAAGIANSHKP